MHRNIYVAIGLLSREIGAWGMHHLHRDRHEAALRMEAERATNHDCCSKLSDRIQTAVMFMNKKLMSEGYSESHVGKQKSHFKENG